MKSVYGIFLDVIDKRQCECYRKVVCGFGLFQKTLPALDVTSNMNIALHVEFSQNGCQ